MLVDLVLLVVNTEVVVGLVTVVVVGRIVVVAGGL